VLPAVIAEKRRAGTGRKVSKKQSGVHGRHQIFFLSADLRRSSEEKKEVLQGSGFSDRRGTGREGKP